jgi:putative hydrolase of the HAD superfamily
MKKAKAILFDLGNVLVRIHPERFFPSLGITDRERQLRLRDGVVETVRSYERGSLTTYDCLQKLGEILQYEFERDAIRRAFAAILGDPIPGMDRIVERVSLNHAIALVSNTNPIHISLAETSVASLHFFPIRFLSYEIRALKPETEYYEKVLRGLALKPAEVVLIDDRQENTDAASALGMTAIVFRGHQLLLEELQAMPQVKL